jgi:hypothetical protein
MPLRQSALASRALAGAMDSPRPEPAPAASLDSCGCYRLRSRGRPTAGANAMANTNRLLRRSNTTDVTVPLVRTID